MFFQGLLPVRLIFDVENNDLLCPVDASNRELFLRDTEHDLTIMMKKSRLEGEQLITSDTLRVCLVKFRQFHILIHICYPTIYFPASISYSATLRDTEILAFV